MSMNPRLLRPLATGFNPKSIAGLQVWLDSQDAATLYQNSDGTTPASAVSDPVGYWADKSGNGRHATQDVANNRPVLSVIDNRTRLSFDGSNDLLQEFSMPAIGTGELSVFFVAATSNTTGFRTAMQVGRGADSTVTPIATQGLLVSQDGANNDGTPQIGRLGGDFLVASAPAFSSSLKVFTGVRSSSTVFSAWIDGVTTTPATGNPSAMDIVIPGYQIGAARFGPPAGNYQFWSGAICEVLIFSSALSAAQRSVVQRFLARKWGITL